MRLFAAVNFSDTVCDTIETAIASFPVENPPWRWVERTNWHVTLKFIGDAPTARVNDIVVALEGVASHHSCFPLTLADFGAFPDLRNPRVLFYNVSEGAEALAALASDIDTALADVGFGAEPKPFHAHATVARVKRVLPRAVAGQLEAARALAGAAQRVDSFELMESRLGRSGARYAPLKQFALTPDA